ncbi:MAG TPA: Do family serine endopeptidase [Blastocatellia bacterium]|nr:Do family serine endopeptidase [Blastocatellia bacterium]
MRPTEPIGQPVRGVEPARKSHSSWIAISIILSAIIISMAIVQAAYYKSKASSSGGGELPAAHPVVNGGGGPSPSDLSTSFRAVAKAVEPAVVSIEVTETVKGHPQIFQFPEGFPQFPGGGSQREKASGSGFIVTPDGYILTNNHVVGKADKIEVTLADGAKKRAERIGTDPDTDLAVIKIEASGLPTAVLGDSDSAEQGDWVLAIGSPFTLQKTITAGIVSAVGRTLLGNGAPQLDRYIQTDASINPGNSGGPLVNMQGEVIGINTLIVPGNTGGNIGIGFAIPSNMVRQVYSQLIKGGKVSRGYLGVTVLPLDAAKAEALNVDPKAGVLVRDTADGNSPAAKAGIRSGDVITTIDGKHVSTPEELTDTVIAMPIGHQAHVDYLRDGEKKSTVVTLAERPSQETLALQRAPQQEPDNGNAEEQAQKLGITVETVTPDVASQRNLRITSGAIVDSVQRDSPAAEAGISRGDVIHQLGRTPINNANDLVQAAKSLKSGDEVAVKIEQDGRMAFVTISID